MPNHCWNEVTVNRVGTTDKSAKEVIDESMRVDEHGISQFTFTKVLPQPDDLFLGNVGANDPEHNWYNWNIKNWGTKWDAYDTMEGLEPDTDDTDLVCFNTAWGPPMPFFEAWSRKYPEFSFDILCDIEGEGPGMPHFVMKNGEQLDLEDIIRHCEECDNPQDECTCFQDEEAELDEAYNADTPVETCPQNNDTSNDCKNCILGAKCRWDGKNCVNR